MNIPLYIEVPNPDQILTVYGAGALGRIERSATKVGGYAEIGTFAIVSGTTFYTFQDTGGTAGYWCQSRYSNVGATSFSNYSNPWQEGVQTNLCALEDVRRIVHVDTPTNTADDGDLLVLMGGVTDLIQTICQPRRFLPENGATYYFDGQWEDPYVLPIPRGIRNVTSLKVRTGGTGSALSSALGVNEYCIRPLVQDRSPGAPGNRIELTELATVNFALPGSEVIEVVGDYDYEVEPGTVERIARETLLRAWRRRGTGMGESLSGGGAAYIEWAMTIEDRKLLENVYAPSRVR